MRQDAGSNGDSSNTEEVASAFDRKAQYHLKRRALLHEAAESQGATVLVVTHDEKVAAQADRRLEIEDGTLIELA